MLLYAFEKHRVVQELLDLLHCGVNYLVSKYSNFRKVTGIICKCKGFAINILYPPFAKMHAGTSIILDYYSKEQSPLLVNKK